MAFRLDWESNEAAKITKPSRKPSGALKRCETAQRMTCASQPPLPLSTLRALFAVPAPLILPRLKSPRQIIAEPSKTTETPKNVGRGVLRVCEGHEQSQISAHESPLGSPQKTSSLGAKVHFSATRIRRSLSIRLQRLQSVSSSSDKL